MLAHPSAISSLSLSPDGRELVSAGHDASLRFWSLENEVVFKSSLVTASCVAKASAALFGAMMADGWSALVEMEW